MGQARSKHPKAAQGMLDESTTDDEKPPRNFHVKVEEGLCPCKTEYAETLLLKPDETEEVLRSNALGSVPHQKLRGDEVKMEGTPKPKVEGACSLCGAHPIDDIGASNLKAEDGYADQLPPRKRQKLDEEPVDLSERANVPSQQIPDDAEFKETMKKMKNPKVKKKEGMSLALDSIKDRLLPIGLDVRPTGVDRNISDVTFSRYFISAIWGGNPQETYPKPKQGFLDKHGLDDWMCITLDHHPHAPEIPGAPGLYFGIGHSEPKDWGLHSWRLIIRLRAGIWQYLGQYKLAVSKPLTNAEWVAQGPKCRDAWADEILTKKWGIPIRAQVYLRNRLDRLPTKDEITDDMHLRLGVKVKDAYKDVVTTQEISAALLRGEISLAVYTMKCVGYDAAFAKDVHKQLPEWETRDRERKAQTKAEAGTKKGQAGNVGKAPKKSTKAKTTTKARVGNKRKRGIEGDDNEEEEEEAEDEESGHDSDKDEDGSNMEDIEPVKYKSRGTRSRPIVL